MNNFHVAKTVFLIQMCGSLEILFVASRVLTSYLFP